MTVKQTAGRDSLGDFAPKFAQLNDDVLFGEVWSRENQLSLRDRSLVTVTALMAQGLTDSSFRHHLESEKKRDHKGRNCGNPDPCGFLCRMAQGLGSVPHGKRGVEPGRCGGRCKRKAC